MPKITKTCLCCGKKYEIFPCRINKSRYCSLSCSGKHSAAHSGPCPKGSIAKMGEKNPMWKGDDAGYWSMHQWIRNQKWLARDGECSQKDATCKGRLEWSNISGEYKRDVEDWQVLCKSHHNRYDGVIPPPNDNWKQNFNKLKTNTK